MTGARTRTEATIEDFDAVTADELAEIEILVTGWASPMVDARRLDAMLKLGEVVHTTGTVARAAFFW